jgi:hypothetical protein
MRRRGSRLGAGVRSAPGSTRWPSGGPGGGPCSCRSTAGPAGREQGARPARGSPRPAGPARTRGVCHPPPAWPSSGGPPGHPGATARARPGKPACRRGCRHCAAAPGRPSTASGPGPWRSPGCRHREPGRSRSPRARRTTGTGPNAAGSPKGACRHPRGTTGSRPPATRRPPRRRPRSSRRGRSPPRTAAGAPAGPPAAVPVTAWPAAPSPPWPSLVLAPPAHLQIKGVATTS